MEVHCFLQWKFLPGPPISGVGSQQDSKLITYLVHWKDLDGNKGIIHHIISMVPRNLWGRDILEFMGAVLIIDDRDFFDDLQVPEKIGLAIHNPMHESHPQF